MSDPERVEIAVDETEIRFQPVKDEDEGLSVTQSTGDISAAGIVSDQDLDIDEGRYEAVARDDSTWAIAVGAKTPDPVGGRSPFVKELRDVLDEGDLEERVTVDEIRANRTEIEVI